MSRLVRTPIIDRNGKATTVHRRADQASAGAARLSALKPVIAEPLAQGEVGDLLEAARLNFGPSRFTSTSARALSRLAQLDPQCFRAVAGTAGSCTDSWAIAWAALIRDPSTEKMDDTAFVGHMRRLSAVFTTVAALEPFRPGPAMATALLRRVRAHEPRRAAAEVFAAWATGTARSGTDAAVCAAEEDLTFIEEHLDALMERGTAVRERGSVDREFLQQILALDTAALADGVL